MTVPISRRSRRAPAQIGQKAVRVLDPERDPDRRVAEVDLLAQLLRHAEMRLRGRMRDQRLGATEADRELHDLQPVQNGDGFGLAAVHLEGEDRAAVERPAIQDRAPGRTNASSRVEIAAIPLAKAAAFSASP